MLNFAEHSLAFFSLFIRAFALVWHWLASAYFIVLFFFSLFDPGNSLKFMMGATVRSFGDYWYRSVCFRYVFPLAGENHHPLATYSA